jgi:hypothetical protein
LAPDVGRGTLARPLTVTALHAARRAAAARGDNPDIAPDSCYILGGVLDDILEVTDAGKSDDTVRWSRGVLAYAGITSNLPKDFLSTEPDALGAHVVLARGDAPTTVSPKTDKLRATLQHCYLWLALASGPGGWHAPFKWIESLDGSLTWLGVFYRRIRLARRPANALVTAARATNALTVHLTENSPATLAIRKIVTLAESDALRPVTFFPTASLKVASLSVSSHGAPRSEDDRALHAQLARALQALGGTRPSPSLEGLRAVASSSSDGSRDNSGAAWGAVFDDGSGLRAMHGLVGDPHAHSDLIELLPLEAIAVQEFHKLPTGTIFTFRTDNLGNCYRINKARCASSSPCFPVLDHIFELADRFSIELVALWCPRAANHALDTLASLRSDRDVAGWCSAQGLRRA